MPDRKAATNRTRILQLVLCLAFSLLSACDDGIPLPTEELFLSIKAQPDAALGSPGVAYTFHPVASGLPNNVHYVWDFHDGSPQRRFSSPQSVSHTWNETGRYYVRLRVLAPNDAFTIIEAQYEANIRNAPLIPEMVRIPAGTFAMGSGLNFTEQPVHTVRISKPFWLGKYEISQAEYYSVTGYRPAWFEGENLPVENVSWFDAVQYCNQLSLRQGLQACYTINGTDVLFNTNADGYRLPTEAEWEYACRAGTDTHVYSGNLIQPVSRCDRSEPAEPNLLKVAWFCRNSLGRTWPVGSKEANSFGLYDMHGNVGEWVWDWFGTNYYQESPTVDPRGPETGRSRVIRGGCYAFGVTFQRSAARGSDNEPQEFSAFYGFRVARNTQ